MSVLNFPYWKRLEASALRAMKTLTVGQTSDLKIDNGRTRVWLARTGVEDGEPCNDKITVEMFIDGQWITQETYAG